MKKMLNIKMQKPMERNVLCYKPMNFFLKSKNVEKAMKKMLNLKV